MRRSGLLERLAERLNARVALPFDQSLRVDDSYTLDALYRPAPAREALESARWLETIRPAFDRHNPLRVQLREVRRLSQNRALALAAQFFMAHETGHGVIEQLDPPVTGREEDAADGFAAWLMLTDPALGPAPVFGAAALLAAIARASGPITDDQLAGTHELARQRVYQLLCWIYGSDPKRYADLVGRRRLPYVRAQRCPAEWRQLTHAWSHLIPAPAGTTAGGA